MYEKILNSLKNKYKDLGLSDKVLGPIAKMLEATTTDEANIETAVAGVEPRVKGMQSEADTRAADAAKKAKAPEQKPADPAPSTEPQKPDDDMPAWAKSLVEANTKIAAEITGLKTEKAQNARLARFAEVTKDFEKAFVSPIQKNLSRMNFATDEEFEAFITETQADYKSFEEQLAQSNLTNFPRPQQAGGQSTAKVDEAVATEIAANILGK